MELSPDFAEALAFAAHLHKGQIRKGSGIPYLSHLLAVASLVLEFGGTEDEAIAGLLHDAVEDQGGRPTLERILRRFGQRVADIVEAVTDTDVVPKPPWRERKEAYIRQVAHASDSARLVGIADKIHNATAILRDYRAVGDEVWSRFNGGKEGTLWYYRSLVDAYRKICSHAILDAFERVVKELEAAVAER